MAGLSGTPANNTFNAILNVATDSTSAALTGSLKTVYDGAGNATPLQLSTASVNVTAFTFNGNALSLAGAFTTSGAFPITLTATGSTNVTLPTSGTLLTSASTITSLGTVTVGTWNATVIGATYGGTGVNNGSSTITLGGNLTTSGANPITFTSTGSTSVTLPTSGTLVNTGVTTLASLATANALTSASTLATIGTVTTGVWNGTAVVGQYGGTGVANTGKTITLGGNLTTSGAFGTTLTVTGTTNVTLPTSGTLISNIAAVKSDQTTGTSTTVWVNPAIQQNHDSACKFWVNFIDSAGSITVNGSYNVTSVTRAGAGQYVVNLTTAFTTANWVPQITCKDAGSGAASLGIVESITSSSVGFNTISPVTTSASNTAGCYVCGFGRQ